MASSGSSQPQDPLEANFERVLHEEVRLDLFALLYADQLLEKPPDQTPDAWLQFTDAWADGLVRETGSNKDERRKQKLHILRNAATQQDPKAGLVQLQKLVLAFEAQVKQAETVAAGPPSGTAKDRAEVQPNKPFSERLHIDNPQFFNDVLDDLAFTPGVILQGSERQGKTWWRHHIVGKLRERADWRVIETDLALELPSSLETSAGLLRLLLEQVSEQLNHPWSLSPGREPAMRDLYKLLHDWHQPIEYQHKHVLWAIDGLDRMHGKPSLSDFLRPLKSWLEETPWLHVLLCTKVTRRRDDTMSSTLTSAMPRPVVDLNRGAWMPKAMSDYGVNDAGLLRALWYLIEGHPYLNRIALYELRGWSDPAVRRQLLLATALGTHDRIFGRYLAEIRSIFEPGDRELINEVCQKGPVEATNSQAEHQLTALGVLKSEGKQLSLRCRLFKRLAE